MRKIVVLTFVTLDGVMQAPGGPEEDTAGDFAYGGWLVPHFDEFIGNEMGEQMGQPFDLLLGRKTFELFASYWPHEESPINDATKYIPSHTLTRHEWEKSVFLSGDIVGDIQKLKAGDGPDIQVHGSSDLIQTLLQHDLVDELWLKIFPVTIGQGKRLFGEGTIPAGFNLLKCEASPSGVIIASYARAGELKTGTVA